MKIKDMFCLDCDHIFVTQDDSTCESCGSENVEELPSNWADDVDGHYEGDFPQGVVSNDLDDE